MAIGEILVTTFQLLIGPTVLGFLVWCYYRVQNDPQLAMPTKMSLDVLESEKPPMDWEKLDDFPEDSQEDNEEESEEVEEKEEKCKDKCCPSEKTEEEDIDDDTMKIKLGVGPQGVKGRPNQGRPDPKTMKLIGGFWL